MSFKTRTIENAIHITVDNETLDDIAKSFLVLFVLQRQ